MSDRLDVAVIGGGAAGLTAAYRLQDRHRVTLFESAGRLGGHAQTVFVPSGPDEGLPLDVGFMVFNVRKYPLFDALLADVGIRDFAPADMSFGYRDEGSGIRYVLNRRGPESAAKLADSGPPPSLLLDILRFGRLAGRDCEGTLAEYVQAHNLSPALLRDYLVPVASALWSSPGGDVARCPARFVIGFLDQHGLLDPGGATEWQTIRGGSARYVAALAARLRGRVRIGAGAVRLTREAGACIVRDAAGRESRFDTAIVATHADQALALLGDPDDAEIRALSPWRYQANVAVLHTDPRILGSDRRFWAAWNWARTSEGGGPSVTYHLNRLQGHVGAHRQYFLTLNPRAPIAEDRVLASFSFEHPLFTHQALETLPALYALNRRGRTYFCGSYFGFGFHEDAVRSACEATAALAAAPRADNQLRRKARRLTP